MLLVLDTATLWRSTCDLHPERLDGTVVDLAAGRLNDDHHLENDLIALINATRLNFNRWTATVVRREKIMCL